MLDKTCQCLKNVVFNKWFLNEKIKSKQRANKYHTVGIVPQFNKKIVERVAHSIPLDVYMTVIYRRINK